MTKPAYHAWDLAGDPSGLLTKVPPERPPTVGDLARTMTGMVEQQGKTRDARVRFLGSRPAPTRELERDEITRANPSGVRSLFSRMIRTSGESASGHHALGAVIWPNLRAWSFSIKTFVSAMLALWIALQLDLDRPYWAMA